MKITVEVDPLDETEVDLNELCIDVANAVRKWSPCRVVVAYEDERGDHTVINERDVKVAVEKE